VESFASGRMLLRMRSRQGRMSRHDSDDELAEEDYDQ